METGVNGNTPVKSNTDLWKELEAILKDKDRAAVKVVWVKGHAGNEFNEMADKLANAAAKEAANTQQ